jgi:hypothetical protein
LSDDSIPVLLKFYGPMFFSWSFVSFRSVRRSGRLSKGVTTGFVVAFGTFCVFYVLNLLRVNLFLAELTGRTDWQSMMQRFRASEFDSLRVFVNMEYLKGAPFKIGVASVIGAVIGLVGGTIARVKSAHFPATVSDRFHHGLLGQAMSDWFAPDHKPEPPERKALGSAGRVASTPSRRMKRCFDSRDRFGRR